MRTEAELQARIVDLGMRIVQWTRARSALVLQLDECGRWTERRAVKHKIKLVDALRRADSEEQRRLMEELRSL